MPQGAQDESLVANVYPLLSSTTQIALHDDVGGVANPLDVTDVATLPHRELVNLENASVNIENSSDVIIGPVTQFNVNGNVIIRHQEGGRLGLDGDSREKKGKEDRDGNKSDGDLPKKPANKTIRYFTRLSLGVAFVVVSLMILKFQQLQPNAIVEPSRRCNTKPYCHHCCEFVTREEWGGSQPLQEIPVEQVRVVVVKHTGGLFCMTLKECSTLTKHIQDNHMAKGAPDIGYNFLVGGDGRAYVGRGFGLVNQFTNDTLDIAVHGNFTYDEFYPHMAVVTQSLISLGVGLGHVATDYKLLCHNQTFRNTLSPGRNVYKHVVSWKHYDNGTYYH